MPENDASNMVAMLTRALATVGSANDRAVERLQQIETQMERASEIDDLPMLKTSMAECLERFREEILKQKNERSRTHEILQVLESAHTTPVSLPDSVTGLPIRADAEAALSAAASSQRPTNAVLLAVDRIALINGRFGYAAGDQMLKLFVEALEARVLPADRIFRWSGPAFVIVIERHERLEKVRDQFRTVVPAKMEKTIHASNRTALISISSTWNVFQVAHPVAGVFQQLDEFLASQRGQGK